MNLGQEGRGFLITAASRGIILGEARTHYAAEIPWKPIGGIDEFPAMCGFLMSPRASYVTAQTICIDGGRVASTF